MNVDLLSVINLGFTPSCVCWVHRRGASLPLLAVASEEDNAILIFDGRCEKTIPLHTLRSVHRAPVITMAFNNAYNCVISVDNKGLVEYWRPDDPFDQPEGVFDLKSSTDLII